MGFTFPSLPFLSHTVTASSCVTQVGKGDDAIKSVDEAQQLSKGSTSAHFLSSTAVAQAHLLQVLQLLLKLAVP